MRVYVIMILCTRQKTLPNAAADTFSLCFTFDGYNNIIITALCNDGLQFRAWPTHLIKVIVETTCEQEDEKIK